MPGAPVVPGTERSHDSLPRLGEAWPEGHGAIRAAPTDPRGPSPGPRSTPGHQGPCSLGAVKWKALLQGDRADLQWLRTIFSGGDLRVSVDGEENYFLESSALEGSDDTWR